MKNNVIYVNFSKKSRITKRKTRGISFMKTFKSFLRKDKIKVKSQYSNNIL